MQGRPRRSVLYMPGSNDRALEKAKTIPADAFIFDLESRGALRKSAPASRSARRSRAAAWRPRDRHQGHALGHAWGIDDLLAGLRGRARRHTLAQGGASATFISHPNIRGRARAGETQTSGDYGTRWRCPHRAHHRRPAARRKPSVFGLVMCAPTISSRNRAPARCMTASPCLPWLAMTLVARSALTARHHRRVYNDFTDELVSAKTCVARRTLGMDRQDR